jgi:protoporphyrinogen oxidase
MPDVGILGAGASGLSFALLSDMDYLLLEAGERPGGHSNSLVVDGWTFDRGPHIIFSRSQLLLDCIVKSLGSNVHQCKRNNKVAILGALARYPIENDLAALPNPVRGDALLSLMEEQGKPSNPRNLAEWFVANFGEVMTDLYFRPYNEKVWNVSLEELSMAWAERIPKPPLEDVVRGALGEVSEGYLHQLFYSYPLTGGYSAIMSAWASGISSERIRCKSLVKNISYVSGSLRVETESNAYEFSSLVSTIPLKYMPRIMEDIPSQVVEAIDRLVVNPMVIATIGFRGVDSNNFTAVYIPDDDFLVNRVSYPGVFSPNNVPEGCFSLQAEITTPPGSPVMDMTDREVLEHIMRGLIQRGLIDESHEPIFEYVERYDQAYVVYTEGFEADRKLVLEWFEERGIYLHGRFGSHQYLNIDGCLQQSIDLVRRLGSSLNDEEVIRRFSAVGSRGDS